MNTPGVFAESNISITQFRVHESPPSVKISAGYFNLINDSMDKLELLKIQSDSFEKIEIHRTTYNNDIASMEKQDSLVINGKQLIEFKPGNFHLMLYQPAGRFTAGDQINFSFQFSSGEVVTAKAAVVRGTDILHENH